MEKVKLIYELLNTAWKTIRVGTDGKQKMTDDDFDIMIRSASVMAKEIGEKHGIAERHLFSKLFNAMLDYLGRKEHEKS